jgi:hypothetical protein
MIVRLVNLGNTSSHARVTLPGCSIHNAWVCGTLEDKRTEIPIYNGAVACDLPARQVFTIRIIPQAEAAQKKRSEDAMDDRVPGNGITVTLPPGVSID